MERLLELGDGWMPMGGDTGNELRDTSRASRSRLSGAWARSEAITFRYTMGSGVVNAALASISKSIAVGVRPRSAPTARPRRVAAEIARFEAAGFDELAINFSGESASEVMEQLDWFGEAVDAIL